MLVLTALVWEAPMGLEPLAPAAMDSVELEPTVAQQSMSIHLLRHQEALAVEPQAAVAAANTELVVAAT